MNTSNRYCPKIGLSVLAVAGVCALSVAALGQVLPGPSQSLRSGVLDKDAKATTPPSRLVSRDRAGAEERGDQPIAGGVCTAFNPRTECQVPSFFIGYNITSFSTADAITAREPVTSICVQGIYLNNVPVQDNWSLVVYADGGG